MTPLLLDPSETMDKSLSKNDLVGRKVRSSAFFESKDVC